jgi:dienelactone hydrolase
MAWFGGFSGLAARFRRDALTDLEAGHPETASLRYLRAALCLLMAERQVTVKTEETLAAYREGLECFRLGVEAGGRSVEFVDVPYEDGALPALFLPADGDEPAPCMVHFDGLDVMKELIYSMGVGRFPERGVSVLICDHPGVGEARRLRNLPARYDVEVPASACVDYLETRADVDSSRIGIMALSLGGYYAPRAAAFEPRFSCCILWGAVWDAEEVDRVAKGPGGEASVDLAQQWGWILDIDPETVMPQIARFKLEPIMDRITCPILVVHGEDDKQVPLRMAQLTYDAATESSKRDLKVFSLDEGGAAHCQIDDLAVGTAYMIDWIAEVWNVDPERIATGVAET